MIFSKGLDIVFRVLINMDHLRNLLGHETLIPFMYGGKMIVFACFYNFQRTFFSIWECLAQSSLFIQG